MSDSDSEELHDIDWSVADPFFDYVDPFVRSPQIDAVLNNDMPLLEALLKSGMSPNVNDNQGNTLLHLAVKHDKREAFDHLLTTDVRLNATNFEEYTPLALAVFYDNEYYVVRLLDKGANVNVGNEEGASPLHLAKSVKIGEMLIKKGADIDAQDWLEETALFKACYVGNSEMVFMLLYYDADPTIACGANLLPFAAAMWECPTVLQEILFNYTFDLDEVPVHLENFLAAMISESPLFNRLIRKTSGVIYEERDLLKFGEALWRIKYNVFKTFMGNFKDVVESMFRISNCFISYIEFISASQVDLDFIYLLCEKQNFYFNYFEAFDARKVLMLLLGKLELPEDTLIKIVCCLLSYGMSIRFCDLEIVYKYQGFSSLFQIMLHMDIVDCSLFCSPNFDLTENYMLTIISYFKCNVTGFLLCLEKGVSEENAEQLLDYFALPRHREAFLKTCSTNNKLMNKLKNVPAVPSLLELSRNSARQYIIEKFKIRNNVQFYTLLKWLPISNIYKDILCYKTKIYNFRH